MGEKNYIKNYIKNYSVLGKNLLTYIKTEIVLFIAVFLSVITAGFVKPSIDYFAYIDYKVICCLFCLMIVVNGLQKTGLFQVAATALIKKTGTLRKITAVLVGLVFFGSMVITNDVALITFIPFALILLKELDNPRQRVVILVLMTIAANIGSSLTPVGNPQNLFLFTFYGLSPGLFFKITVPIVFTGGVLLLASLLLIKNDTVHAKDIIANYQLSLQQVSIYLILFLMSILAVFNVIPYLLVCIIVFLSVLIVDRSILTSIDYSLLLTFVFFFIFIGNIQKIPVIHSFLASISRQNIQLVSASASQVISNVPAAILFSSFTEDFQGLIRGVSLGGLGSLVSSLASVITYKLFTHSYRNESKSFMAIFTIINSIFLILLFGLTAIV